MRVAITADTHLRSRAATPGRYAALENILQQSIDQEIEKVIIAGDLFDDSQPSYSDFDSLCRQSQFSDLEILVIPGNHDPDIRQGDFVAENLIIIEEPRLFQWDNSGLGFLFVPYEENRTMGQSVAPLAAELSANRWVLIGHGDWSEALHTPNPYEPGIYMPLTRRDIEAYKPALALLGHIHMPLQGGKVHYPGSPYPIDINEPGYRRFLVLDTQAMSVEAMKVETGVIYFDEQFIVLPVEDEEAYLTDLVADRVEQWGVEDSDENKVRVRIRVSGYSADRKLAGEVIEKSFSRFSYYKDEPPDLSELRVSRDDDRDHIAQKARARIEDLQWSTDPNEPSSDDILLSALRLIYGD